VQTRKRVLTILHLNLILPSREKKDGKEKNK